MKLGVVILAAGLPLPFLRVGRSQAEFERELSLRAAFLREVVDAGRTSVPAFRAALATYRGGGSAHTHSHPAN